MRRSSVASAFVAVLVSGTVLLSCSADRTALKARGTHSEKPVSLREGPESTNVAAEKKVALTRALERMPLYFIENRGQLDPRVAFTVQGTHKTLYFSREGVTIALLNPGRTIDAPLKGSDA